MAGTRQGHHLYSGVRPGRRRAGALLLVVLAALLLAGCQGAPTAPATPVPVKPHSVVVIGDSLSTGFGTTAKDAWPNLINTGPSDPKDPLDLVNAAQNGSGYVTVGDNNSTFGTQVKLAVTADTEMVLFFGSENDRGHTAAEIGDAATAAYAAAKTVSPHAAILVVGPPAYSNQPEANRLAVRDAVQDAAQAAGATFVDPIAQGWIMGHVAELIGPDGVHPSVAGQHFIQGQMEKLIKQALAQLATAASSTPSSGAN